MNHAAQHPITSPPATPLSASLYHAHVLQTGGGFKVRPPVAQVNRRADPFFRFKNNTEHPADVLLPADIVGGSTSPVPVDAHSWVEIPLTAGGTFSYVVVLTTPGGKVSVPGESDPVIIIDP